MTAHEVHRRLAAILAADVVGYSRLMGEDERGTLAVLRAHREELIEPKIAQHEGRIVKLMGDGLLAEFPSAVEAVQCAVEIQHSVDERDADLPKDKRIIYRVGINIGDVILEGQDIYGDGVNVAARLEELCEPGGICVSRNVFNQVKGKLDLTFEHVGEREVKNITEPVTVYRVILDAKAAALVTPVVRKAVKPASRRWAATGAAVISLFLVAGAAFWWRPWAPDVEPAQIKRMAFPLPNKPSLVVLPFTNMSDDPSQDYFTDGMTEDLITDLSKISGLFVIARNSSFSYKGQQVDVRQVAEELGVRYVLEGSVRRADDKVRINAQLIDATTGGHLWAERYDDERQDVFTLQDSVTERIVSALAVHLTAGEKAQVSRRETHNIEAYDAFLQGWEHYRRRTPRDFAKAAGFFERAVELDPQYGQAYAALAMIYWKSWVWSVQTMSPAVSAPWTRTLDISVVDAPDRAEEYLQIAMQNPTPLAHQVASEIRWRNRQYDEAIAEAERAINLNTNDSAGYVAMAEAMIFGGQPKEAVQFIEKATRLDPHAAVNLYILGLAHFSMAQLEEAAILFERAFKRSPLNQSWKAPLAAAYAHMGNVEKARSALGDYGGGLYTVQDIMALWPFNDAKVAKRFAIGIVKAGVCCEENLRYYLDDLRKAGLEE